MNRRDLLRSLGFTGLALHPALNALPAQQSTIDPIMGSASSSNAVSAILQNQLGYLPTAQKHASLRSSSSKPIPFRIRSLATNKVVFKGSSTPLSPDAASGDSLHRADFSAFTTPGTYKLEAAGLDSDPFPIAPNAYADALKLTMRSFYGQRCGCAVNLGNGYQHPACHLDGAFHPTSGKSGPLVNHGGWHDAGDYGRYIVNSGLSTGTLLWAWELYPQTLTKLTLEIPKSGQKFPDYLAEIRWNLEWMLSLQDSDGGVWHKQTSEHFCAFILPQDDLLPSYVIGTGATPYKSTCATADFAAVMAIAARVYQPYDADFAQRCLTAAQQAWTWAIAYPNTPFKNPPTISTGEYGDRDCADEIQWASAELFRSTGDTQYEKAFLATIPTDSLKVSAPGWGEVASMAYWTYALASQTGKSATSAAIKSRILQATQSAAQALLQRSQQSGYGNTLGLTEYHWGSNGTAANQSLLLLIAHHFLPNPTLREAALNNLHYILGRNCFGISWVTQLGIRPFQHPHHRPSAADKIPAPWPGLLSGGPNATGGDPTANKLPKLPPMRMWLDDEAAYSLNEIAINWNAPLVFLLAAANS